jgi:hypothetical protein
MYKDFASEHIMSRSGDSDRFPRRCKTLTGAIGRRKPGPVVLVQGQWGKTGVILAGWIRPVQTGSACWGSGPASRECICPVLIRAISGLRLPSGVGVRMNLVQKGGELCTRILRPGIFCAFQGILTVFHGVVKP